MSSRQIILLSLVLLWCTGFTTLSVQPPAIEPNPEKLSSGKPFIHRIEPESRGGEAYEMVYSVPVPIEIFWRFKTDFHGDFIETNKYVREQGAISLGGGMKAFLEYIARWE